MANDEDVEFLNDQDIVLSIGEHINELQEIATEIAEHRNFEGLAALHNEKWSAMGAPSDRFWRGADIEVVNSSPGDGKEDWHARVLNPGYHMDEPCPSRFPLVVSGLIWRLQENARYIVHTNKYEWYGTIAEACQELEARSSLPDEEEVCRTVIYRLTQLLVRWRDIILEELNKPLEPNLYDEGWRLYFGFGRNVNQKAMLSQDRCPSARFICLLPYENHRFAIDSRGYATIVEEEGKKVWGALWAVPPQDLSRLDLREGVRKDIYRRETRELYHPIVGHDIDVEVYISNSEEGSVARDGYIEEIIQGFQFLGAPEQYYEGYTDYIGSSE